MPSQKKIFLVQKKSLNFTLGLADKFFSEKSSIKQSYAHSERCRGGKKHF
jgi:hypothetical protein